MLTVTAASALTAHVLHHPLIGRHLLGNLFLDQDFARVQVGAAGGVPDLLAVLATRLAGIALAFFATNFTFPGYAKVLALAVPFDLFNLLLFANQAANFFDVALAAALGAAAGFTSSAELCDRQC